MTLGIEQTSYTATEGIELSVCLTYSGGELSGVNLTYEARTIDGTATAGGVGKLILLVKVQIIMVCVAH